MQKLTDLIGKRLNQHKLGESAKAAEVIFAANQLIQGYFDVEPSEIEAIQLKNGVLLVRVASAVWNQEFWGYQEFLLADLRERFGSKLVQSIRMVT